MRKFLTRKTNHQGLIGLAILTSLPLHAMEIKEKTSLEKEKSLESSPLERKDKLPQVENISEKNAITYSMKAHPYFETGCPEDTQEGIRFLKLAAEHGERNAQTILGKIYLEGKYVPQDVTRGIRFLKLAADQGESNAQTILGKIYLGGKCVAQDVPEGIRLLKLAVDQGNRDAQTILGWIYLDEKYVPQDVPEGIRLLKLAAEQEERNAQATLGQIYLYGEFNVSKNVPEGIRFLILAENQGNVEAGDVLGKEYKTLKKRLEKKHDPRSNNHVKIYGELLAWEKAGEKRASTLLKEVRNLKATRKNDDKRALLTKAEQLLASPEKSLPADSTKGTRKQRRGRHQSKSPQNKVINTRVEAQKAKKDKKTSPEKASPVSKELASSPTPLVMAPLATTSSTTTTTTTLLTTSSSHVPLSTPPLEEKKESTKKEKPKRTLRIKLTQKTQEIRDKLKRKKEVREEKKKKDNLSTKQKSTPSDSLSLTESLLDKSHFSITDSASQSYRSQFSESESFREEETQITTQMREAYPGLYRLLRKASKRGVLHLPQVRFRNSNLIRGTLFQMKHAGYIEGEIKQDKISVNKVGDHPIAFRAHTTHGSGSYAKWYHNPEVVLNYFIFLAQCDPVIKNYCQATFGEGCFSRDLEDGLGDTSRPD